MSEYISSQEDELNILLDKLTKTISAFTTLSREQAEKAIIEANAKIKDCENIIEKMENFINNKDNNISPKEIIELNKKINNYKNEFKILVNKYNITQSTYINKKAETALIDDIEISINHNKNDLIDDDSTKNEKKEKTLSEGENKFKIGDIQSNNANNVAFEKNIGNMSGVNNTGINNTISEEVFRTINMKSSKKKKKLYCALIIFLSVVVISAILYLIVLTNKKNNK